MILNKRKEKEIENYQSKFFKIDLIESIKKKNYSFMCCSERAKTFNRYMDIINIIVHRTYLLHWLKESRKLHMNMLYNE